MRTTGCVHGIAAGPLPAERHDRHRGIFSLQVLIALPAAYALAKLKFWGRNVAFAAVLFCILIPYQAIAVPLFVLLHALGLLNSYAALIVPFTIWCSASSSCGNSS